MIKIAKNKGVFPTFAVIILVLSILWLLSAVGVLASNIPWLPIIFIILALGGIHHHKHCKK